MGEYGLYVEIAILVQIMALAGLIWFLIENQKRTEERMNDLEQGVATVLQIVLEKITDIAEIKDYIPQFSINQNPLQPLIEAFAQNMWGEGTLSASELPRTAEGRFDATESQTQTPETPE